MSVGETVDSRSLQERWYFCSARDADETTGRRVNASSFFDDPNVERSPETTLWREIDDLPGVEKGVNASGFETSYDQARVSSAMAVAEIPLYNYATNMGKSKLFLGSYIGFELDGMFTGYR